MAHQRDGGEGRLGGSTDVVQAQSNPGRRTLTSALQRKGDGGGDAGVQSRAAEGVAGPGGPLPFADTIQASFGDHDLGGVRAHTDAQASSAAADIGAQAYATGTDIAFGAEGVDLHTAAHEAAHVVQQRAGVHLSGGVGQAGDPYEQHADAVADLVVSGQSAEPLLDAFAGSGGSATPVQGRFVQRQDPPAGAAPAGAPPAGAPPAGAPPAGAAPAAGAGTSLIVDGTPYTDWTLAVNQIQVLYVGTNLGLGYLRGRGVDTWWMSAQHDDPPPVWQDILVGAIGIAVAAATAGIGAVITAPLAGAALGAATAAIEAGQNIGQSAAQAAVGAAMAAHSTDGKAAYKDATTTTIDRAVGAEWRALNARLQSLAREPDSVKWPALQSLYNAALAGTAVAQDKQYGETVEGWMSASAQSTHGRDFLISGRSLRSMYYSHQLELSEMQGIQGHLTIGQPLNRLRADLQAALVRATGHPIAELEAEGITSGGGLAVSYETSSVGTLGLHIELGDTANDPTVEYGEIESSTAINDDTRNYFLHSPKTVAEFRVPKILVGSGGGDLSIGVTENNEMTIDTGVIGEGAQGWLTAYAARRINIPDTRENRGPLLAACKAFLSHALLQKTLAQLGVRELDS